MTTDQRAPGTRRIAVGVLAALLVAACSVRSDVDGDASGATDAASARTPTTTSAPDPTTTALAPTTAIATPEPIPIEPPEGQELVWSDEFDGDEIDRSNWTYDLGGGGWGNGEAQHYTDRPENARLQNGLLVIELRQEQYEDSYFTSARLKTQGLREFQYGRIEARLKVPEGVGTWPAFWMLGAGFERASDEPSRQWPNVGEIDIMEYVGREPDLVIGTIHGPGYAGSAGISRWNRQAFAIADDFHTFAVDWDADGLRWLFDGEVFFDLPRERVGRREWVFDQPFFMILNLALGGTLGGTIAPDLVFPMRYYVDYVRVYQQIGGQG